MKLWPQIAGAGLMAVGMLFLAACGNEPTAAVGQPDQALMAEEPGRAQAAPIQAAAEAPAPLPFTPEMSAEFMRQVMEASARIEALNAEIAARQTVLFETHPEVKVYRAQLIAMQGQINKILAEDEELASLQLNRDIMWSTMPVLPRGPFSAGPGRSVNPMR